MNFLEFQEIINKINGVIVSKVHVENDNLTEIHVLASNSRSPKQIVRDIESSIMASFNYRIDRKIISIAQIQSEDNDNTKRIKFIGVSFNSSDKEIECSVRLKYDEEEFSASQTGIKTIWNRKRIVADTTLKALEKVLGKSPMFEVQDVMILTKNETSFVTVLVNLITNENEEALVGSVIVGNDTNEAIAKATLDAVNRRIELIKN